MALSRLPMPVQVTTSYRTGSADSGGEDENNRLLSAKSYRERFRALRKEYKDSGADRIHDTGHPFETTKSEIVSISHPRVYLYGKNSSSSTTHHYEGPLIPSTAHSVDGAWATINAFNSTYYGVRAIAKTMPTNPASDLAVSLAEIKREGLPSITGASLFRDQVSAHKKLGSEYLNIEFGWKPLVGATVETMNAVAESARILRQYQRDSGRWVRRDYTFPEEITQKVNPLKQLTTGSTGTYLVDPRNDTAKWSPLWTSGATQFHDHTKTTRQVYFRGAYSYYLQSGNSHLNKLFGFEQKARRLLGLELTPEVLWELSPWSWLVDWNLNVQDNIHNAEALNRDGLVIRYGYLMCKTVSEHTLTVTNVTPRNGPTFGPITVTYRITRKQRVRAEPYGFGSNPAAYTSRQWAILAALGMTKAPNILRSS